MAETWDWELLAGPATITEGPAWDGSGLFYTSIDDNEIRRYDLSTGDIVTVYNDTGASNGLAFDRDGGLRIDAGGSPAFRRVDRRRRALAAAPSG